MKTKRQEFVERISFRPWKEMQRVDEKTNKQAFITVEERSLDPEVYLAVVPTEFGEAGVLNRNGRIYPVERFIAENHRLNERAQGRFVGGENEHPFWGETFSMVFKIMEVHSIDQNGDPITVTEREDGRLVVEGIENITTARSVGEVAFLNTGDGKDVFVQYQAGREVGTSSRSYGLSVEHVLDEKSPYLDANKQNEGKKIVLVEEQELITYDAVTDPSAGTMMGTNESTTPVENRKNETPGEPVKENAMTVEQINKLVLEAVAAARKDDKPDAPIDPTVITSAVTTALTGVLEANELSMKVEREANALALKESKDAAAKAVELLNEMKIKSERQEEGRIAARAFNEATGKVHENIRTVVTDFVRAELKLTESVKPDAITGMVERAAAFASAVSKKTVETTNIESDNEDDESVAGKSDDTDGVFGEGFDALLDQDRIFS